MAKVTNFALGYYVESWWDKQSRNWITTLCTAEGDQLGEAMFSGNRESMIFDHDYMVSDAHLRIGQHYLEKIDI